MFYCNGNGADMPLLSLKTLSRTLPLVCDVINMILKQKIVSTSFLYDIMPGVKVRRNACSAIRYDTVYLTCTKKLRDSQLSLPYGTNKKYKRKKTENKLMSVISLVQSHDHEVKVLKC